MACHQIYAIPKDVDRVSLARNACRRTLVNVRVFDVPSKTAIGLPWSSVEDDDVNVYSLPRLSAQVEYSND